MNFLLKHLEDTFACLGTEARPKPYKSESRDFPGGLVAGSPHSQYGGPRVQSLVGELEPTQHN